VLLAVVLTALVLAGLLAPVWVFVLGLLAGVVRPNDLVMRNSLIGETIPPPHLIGAVGMSRASTDSARVAGALAGAGLWSLLGLGQAYLAITALYLASFGLTLGESRRHPVPDPAAPPRAIALASFAMPRGSRFRELKDGLVHVVTTPTLHAAMWLAFLVNLTAYPLSSGLLAYVAQRVYLVDATGLGSGMVALTLAGFVQSIAMISMTGTLLAAAGDQFRARVMGVRTLAVYGMPLGLIGSGLLIERIGYQFTVGACCAVGLLFTVYIGIRWRTSMWQTRRPLSSATASSPPRVRGAPMV
jgi:hypothetical protein